jgi:D-glycero-D-manno-heptose 1,7-bisphosphate phosphatase
MTARADGDRDLSAVLFDRDGTLVVDVPYNGDPAAVVPMPGAVEAVRAVREAGLATAVVTNQSGIARGMLSPRDVALVNSRVDELFGAFDAWCVCPHGPNDHCSCRKPAPGLVLDAAARLGVDPAATVVIGDIGADVAAAIAAGAQAVLVPTAVTRREEVASAPAVARDLGEAVRLVLERRQGR